MRALQPKQHVLRIVVFNVGAARPAEAMPVADWVWLPGKWACDVFANFFHASAVRFAGLQALAWQA